jgi:hypothetical protein
LDSKATKPSSGGLKKELWAQPVLNRRPPPFKSPNIKNKAQNEDISNLQIIPDNINPPIFDLTYTPEDLSIYLVNRCQGLSQRSIDWLDGAAKKFWENTQDLVNIASLSAY